MAKAVRGTGETDAKTKTLLKEFQKAQSALSRHLGTAKARRNTSKAVAATVQQLREESGVTLSNLSSAMDEIISIRESQATAVPGKTSTGKPRRRVVRRK